MKTPNERKKLLEEVESYKKNLSPDPSITGLKVTYSLASELDSYRTRTGSILLESIGDVTEMEKILKDLKFDYEKKFNKEISKENIKILKSGELREAAANLMLGFEQDSIHKAERELLDAQTFIDQIRQSYTDLKDKIRTIRQQIDIVALMETHGELDKGFKDRANRVRLTIGDPGE